MSQPTAASMAPSEAGVAVVSRSTAVPQALMIANSPSVATARQRAPAHMGAA